MHANAVNLATGQQMATFNRDKGVQIKTLTKEQIKNGKDGADLSSLTVAELNALAKDTPL